MGDKKQASTFVIPLKDCEQAKNKVGGKAANLGRLIGFGAPVPSGSITTTEDQGFAITVDAFQEFLASNALTDKSTEADLLAEKATVSPELQEAIKLALSSLDKLPVAVRSSGTAEDGTSNAFAGIYETYLNVKPKLSSVVRNVKKCWASTRSERVAAYKASIVIDALTTESAAQPADMGVVVQTMVPAKAAGVLFTVDPIENDANVIVIDCTSGLGENVVSGLVVPENIRIDKKKFAIIAPAADTTIMDREGGDFRDFIPEAQVIELAKLATKLEAKFGAPQDFEWAYDGERLFVLQARPITTLAKKPNSAAAAAAPGQLVDLLSSKHTKESMGFVMTPLTSSTFLHIIDSALLKRYKAKGIRYPSDRAFYEVRRGRLYQNVTLCDELNSAEFGTDHQPTLEDFKDELPVDVINQHLPKLQLSFFGKAKGIFTVLGTLWRNSATLTQAIKECETQRAWASGLWMETKLPTDVKQLEATWNDMENRFVSLGGIYIELTVHQMILAQIIKSGTEKLSPEEATQTTTAVLSGIGGSPVADIASRIESLAKSAKKKKTLVKYFAEQDASDKPFADWKEQLKETKLGKKLSAFLDEFGYRARYDLEVSSPRWKEDPTLVLKMISGLIGVASDSKAAADKLEALAKKREQAEAKLLAQVGFMSRGMVKWAMQRIREVTRVREINKDLIILFIAVSRKLLMHLAAQPGPKSALGGEPDRIFFVPFQKLTDLWNTKPQDQPKLDALISQVKEAQKDNAAFLREPHHDAVIGQTPYTPPVDKTLTTPSAQLKGVAASTGQVTGVAVVASSPEEALKKVAAVPNAILVVATTDPSWCPLFFKVLGVVAERGGVLSHSAITARELGMPAAVSVRRAMELLKDGDKIVLDGSLGVVTKVAE